MSALAAHGFSINVPAGWDALIEHAWQDPVLAPPAPRLDGDRVPRSGTTNPQVHLANFALPSRRGDYGLGAVELMQRGHIFIALVEFDREAASTAMYQNVRGLPSPSAGDFHPHAQQRVLPGMCGTQMFFNDRGRALCLYVVLGSWSLRRPLVAKTNVALAGVTILDRP
jgi:hypothetical protein